jgi:hypothetical protein
MFMTKRSRIAVQARTAVEEVKQATVEARHSLAQSRKLLAQSDIILKRSAAYRSQNTTKARMAN